MTITIKNYVPSQPGNPNEWTREPNRAFIHKEGRTDPNAPWMLWAGNTNTGQLSEGSESFATFAEAIAAIPAFMEMENAQ